MSNFMEMTKSEFIKKTIMIVLGSFICALGINLFIIPSHLLSGGLSGIALIFQYILKIPAGYTILALNVPLFIISFIKINKKFTLFTGIGTIALSVSLIITDPLSKTLSPVPNSNMLLYCIYGGVLSGLGLGLVFTNQGSTGGMDIVSMLAKQKYDMELGTITFIINFIIVSIGSLLFNFEIGLYTLIVMYSTSLVMDKVIKGFSKQKMLLIITNKQDEVSNAVMNNLRRGMTVLYGEGAYTRDRKNVMYCVVSLRQLPKVKQLIKKIDEDAFISIIDTSEVQGKGFTSPF
ncbi:hypothetical protein CLTEP_16440 [Clostridium tepidiprofundi DSM 19306]|uniref:DUF2179 domain-containing protein n=1 Tax=Clostridium tepidiprofundi DSM 19306 TaxID=1121338 RepID=A0A151B3C6_9CLOT|nr:YitT family protein [Clostridium tepidiprofundi]KYH34411.1 hypothetical protein CLTEP_16440 [Clostridium tepidiprofundi DSM 19306]